jgi:hypothetical protein
VPSNKAVYNYVNTTVQKNKYTAGNNITISEDNKINSIKYTAGKNITISDDNIIDCDIPSIPTVVSQITDENAISSAIPTVAAVKTYVQNNTPEITPSDCVQFISTDADISAEPDASGKIYIIPSGTSSGLVYTKYNDKVIQLSVEAIDKIDANDTANYDKLVTSKAIIDYISGILGPIQQQLDDIVK